MKLLFVWPNKDSFGYKPISISLLSAIAVEQGWEVELFDTTSFDFGFNEHTKAGEEAAIFKPVDLSKYNMVKEKKDLEGALLEKLREFSPDCVALSVLSDEWNIAKSISHTVKQSSSAIPVIWGNKFPTLEPVKCLEECYADFVCIGEGIDAFREFLYALEKGKDPHTIKNIWSKKGAGIVKQELRPLRPELDDLPYLNWDIFDKRHFIKPYDGNVYFSGDHMSNWGCPNRCSYCINDFYRKMYDNKYFMRRYTTGRIIDELKWLKDKWDIKFMKFHDEDFLMRPMNNLEEFSDLYRREVNIPFTTAINPISVTKEKVELLKKMNCVSVSLGIETGNCDLRKNVLKRTDTEEQVIKAFKCLNAAGIRTSSFIMLGIPFETRKTFFETVELTRKAKVQYPNICFFFPFEGSELRDTAIKNGFFDPNDTTQTYKRDEPALHFEGIEKEELIELRKVFTLYVKLPEKFFPYIQRSETTDELGLELRKKLIRFYNETVFLNDGWYKEPDNTVDLIEEMDVLIKHQG
jgi:radical SAM superfamily enzyme YgiQ (UPF0313 family)